MEVNLHNLGNRHQVSGCRASFEFPGGVLPRFSGGREAGHSCATRLMPVTCSGVDCGEGVEAGSDPGDLHPLRSGIRALQYGPVSEAGV